MKISIVQRNGFPMICLDGVELPNVTGYYISVDVEGHVRATVDVNLAFDGFAAEFSGEAEVVIDTREPGVVEVTRDIDAAGNQRVAFARARAGVIPD